MFLRPSWDEYFIQIADLTKQRSNCCKRQVGCIIVSKNRILSLGYNGTPRGTINCYEGGCERCNSQSVSQSGIDLDLCMCLHAEDNAIMFISESELENSTLYVTLHPCISCAKKIIQCRIKRVVFIEDYQETLDTICSKMLKEAGVIIERYPLSQH